MDGFDEFREFIENVKQRDKLINEQVWFWFYLKMYFEQIR